MRPQLKRDKVLYDSDLGRAWKRSNEKGKTNLKKLTGFNEEFFNELPTGINFSIKAIESSSNIITPKSLGMPSTYSTEVNSKSLVIEINNT